MPHKPRLQLHICCFGGWGRGLEGSIRGPLRLLFRDLNACSQPQHRSSQYQQLLLVQDGMLHMQGTFFLLEKLKLTVLRRLLMRCCILHLEASAADTNPHHFPLGRLLVHPQTWHACLVATYYAYCFLCIVAQLKFALPVTALTQLQIRSIILPLMETTPHCAIQGI